VLAEHGGFSLRRRPDLPVCDRVDSAADHAWSSSGGMPSSSRNAWVESWQFAPVSSIANGMPRPSQIKWRWLPRLARSVGFAPVCGPQKLLALGTSRSGHHEKDNSATRSEAGPKFRRCCQSRNRRQQVMPEPQPNCFGSIPQGMPLRSTNRIPVRQARSDTRGRPPCGFGIEAGRSGRIKLHSASGTSAAAMRKSSEQRGARR
jgi:hypothetical protein